MLCPLSLPDMVRCRRRTPPLMTAPEGPLGAGSCPALPHFTQHWAHCSSCQNARRRVCGERVPGGCRARGLRVPAAMGLPAAQARCLGCRAAGVGAQDCFPKACRAGDHLAAASQLPSSPHLCPRPCSPLVVFTRLQAMQEGLRGRGRGLECRVGVGGVWTQLEWGAGDWHSCLGLHQCR